MEGSPFTSTISILDDDKPLLVLEENTGQAVALESVWSMRDPFALGKSFKFKFGPAYANHAFRYRD